MKRKYIAIGLVAVLSTGLFAGCADTDTENKNDTASEGKSEEYQVAEGEGFGYKEETVWVTTDGNGEVLDVTVSEWLKNTENIGALKDATNLLEIENVKGNEEFSEENGIITFKTDGRDIYYQGKPAKDTKLPVNLKISYTLDGNAITAEALAGKSGHLVMNIEYEATETVKAETGGEEKEIYVPFLAVTGMLLPAEKFDNVSVVNGTLLSNGNYELVAGYGFAGITESMKAMGLEEISGLIPAAVTLEADVTDYEVSMMMTVVTNSFLSEADVSELENAETAEDFMAALGNGVSEGGASSLEDMLSGVTELTEGIDLLNAGSDELSAGTAELKAGVEKVNQGAAAIQTNMATLSAGLAQAYAGGSALNAKVLELAGGTKQLQSGASLVDAGVDKLVTEMSALYKNICDTLDTYGARIAESKETIDSLNAAVAAGNTGVINEKTLAAIQGYYQMQGAYGALMQIKTLLEAKDASGKTVFENLQLLAAGTESLKEGSNTLAAGAEQLYKDGSSVLESSLKQLSEGSAALEAGTKELAQGTASLETGAEALNAGAMQLAAGIDELSAGIDDMLENISEAFAGNLDSMLAYVKAVTGAAKEYRSLTDMDASQEGSVKFIIKTN